MDYVWTAQHVKHCVKMFGQADLVLQWRDICVSAKGKNVTGPYITESKYLCFTGKIIKSVPSKLIKEVRNALNAQFLCMSTFTNVSHHITPIKAATRVFSYTLSRPFNILHGEYIWERKPAVTGSYTICVLCLLSQKGQHLEPFIQSFFNSCESPKPKPSRPELTILSPTSENDKKVGFKSFIISDFLSASLGPRNVILSPVGVHSDLVEMVAHIGRSPWITLWSKTYSPIELKGFWDGV